MDAFQVENVAPISTPPHFGDRLSTMIHGKNKSGTVWGVMAGPARAVIFYDFYLEREAHYKKAKLASNRILYAFK